MRENTFGHPNIKRTVQSTHAPRFTCSPSCLNPACVTRGVRVSRAQYKCRRANGSIRFEFNDTVDEGLSFGIQILEERPSIWSNLRGSFVKP